MSALLVCKSNLIIVVWAREGKISAPPCAAV